MDLGAIVAVLFGLLLAVVGLALIVVQLLGRPGGAIATTPPPAGAAPLPDWRRQLRALGARLRGRPVRPAPRVSPLTPAAAPLSTPAERQQRLQELRTQHSPLPATGDPIGGSHQAPTLAVPAAQGELVPDAERLPPALPRYGGRPPRQTAAWRGAVAQRTPADRGSTLRGIVGAVALLGVVALLIALLIRGIAGAPPVSPGSATLAIADFGAGPGFAKSDLGHTEAQTIGLEVTSGFGSAAAQARMPVVYADLVRSDAEAQQMLDQRHAQALLWGTLPAGGNGPISATLAWRGSPPPAPWLRFGPTGRLLLPATVPLPNQPLIAIKALAPVLEAVQYYQAGDYDTARLRAESLPPDAPASTLDLAAFIRANSLIAVGRAKDALPLYQALEARGWINPALYNNWGLAAELTGDYGRAVSRFDQAARLSPTPPPAVLAAIYTNRGIAAQEAGDLDGAQTTFDQALRLQADDPEANWRRGYIAYRRGDSTASTTYTDRALAAAPDNPNVERQAGLIALMQRQGPAAVDHFQKALQTYTSWHDSLQKDEGAAGARNDQQVATRLAEQIDKINGELGTTSYYIGLAYADQARDKPPEGFLQGLWRRLTGDKSEADRAIDAFDAAIRLDKDRPDIRYQMGILYWHEGDRTRARDNFALAITLQPENPAPYEALAAMDLEDNKPDQAIAEYQALIKADPRYLSAYIALAELDNETGHPDDATQVYAQVAALPAGTPREHFWRAQALAGLGRPAEAVAEARTAFLSDPSLWEAHFLLGTIYQAAGQDPAALAEYESVLKQEPKNVAALYEAGRLEAAHGHTTEARQLWSQVASLEPSHPTARLGDPYGQRTLADWQEVYFALGGLDEQQASLARQAGNASEADRWTEQALQEYKTAVSQKADRADGYYHLGQIYEQKTAWREAEQNYNQAVQLDPNLVEGWQGLVRVLLKQPGRDADALKFAQAFQQHAPNDIRADLLLGDVFLFRNDPSAAMVQYTAARKIQADNPQALYGLGRAYADEGDFDHAAQYYTASLQAQPGNVLALTGQGDLALDRGLYGQAQNAYNAALVSDPNYAPAYVGLGRTLDHLSPSDPSLGDEAKKKLEHAAALDPSLADAPYYLGELYAERAPADPTLWDPAVRAYTQAANLRPSWAMPYFRLGFIYLSQKKTAEAVRAYQQATRLDPNMIEAWFGLGQAERDSEDRKDAIAAYQQAIKLKNDYASAWLYLGYTLKEDGQRPQALDAFHHALDSATDNAAIRNAAQDALNSFQ
ncbi:MAG TPA: tetratricopeptide repeat protein [Chloroflexia bacterium]|nr:tetratricopeptide repeat protein [Chloroflexia bacterium]